LTIPYKVDIKRGYTICRIVKKHLSPVFPVFPQRSERLGMGLVSGRSSSRKTFHDNPSPGIGKIMPEVAFFGQTDVGIRRKNNEDTFVVSPGLCFCLAADGMGGAAAGELASRFFADSARDVFSGTVPRTEKQTFDLVQKAFSLANRRILEHVKANAQHQGMGCTAELVAFFDGGFVLGHIGDSRTYRLRDGHLKQLTQDHSFVQCQIDQGLITPEEARNHHLRNVILRAVGVTENLPLDLLSGRIFPGDLFLLCSDGLTDMLDDETIRDILLSAVSLAEKSDELIRLANAAGGKDNITVVLSEVL